MSEIPAGYEKIDHHNHLSLFNEELGIVITIHEYDRFHREHGANQRYPYRVNAARNQETLYKGAFDSISHAEKKVMELAEKHPVETRLGVIA